QLARVEVGAPDRAVDVMPPEVADAVVSEEKPAGVGDLLEVDPFDIGVIIRASALGERGDVAGDVAGLVDIPHLVREAVEVAENLAEEAATDFVFELIGGKGEL